MQTILHGRNRCSLRRAFTLVDTIAAIALLGISAVALIGGLRMGLSQVRTAEEQMRATQILLEKLEGIRLCNWDQITDPNFLPSTFDVPYNLYQGTNGVVYHGTLNVEDAPFVSNYTNQLKRITIQLTWNSGIAYTNSIQALVAENGMQDYIY